MSFKSFFSKVSVRSVADCAYLCKRSIEEQKLIRKLAGESILPKLEINISDNNIESAVEKIADWMESTGGLSMKT